MTSDVLVGLTGEKRNLEQLKVDIEILEVMSECAHSKRQREMYRKRLEKARRHLESLEAI